jgi:hypothetical protein
LLPLILFSQSDETKSLWNNKLLWRVPAGNHQGALAHDIEYDAYTEASRNITSQWGIVLAAKDFKACDTCAVEPYKASQTLYRQVGLNSSYFPVIEGGDQLRKYWRQPFPELWVYDLNGEDRNWNEGVMGRNDYLDENIPSDQMVTSTANSSIGLSVTQNVYIWTNTEFQDFIIVEYIFTNTGNYNADDEIENLNNQLSQVYIGLQSMSQVSSLGRLVVANNGGILSGNDDWVDYYGDESGDALKVIYAWDGDASDEFATGYDEGDPLPTTGQPVSPQYIGRAVLYAQQSVADAANDPNQPVTTHYSHWGTGGNLIVTSGTSEGDAAVYQQLSSGDHIQSPFDSLAWVNGQADAYGNIPATDEYLKTATMAFGPYDFTEPDQSIRIITCLAVGSISFEQAIELGEIHVPGSAEYLKEIRSGRDLLFAAVEKAKWAFYESQTGWDFNLEAGSTIDKNIKDPMPAPSVHYISENGHVRINWENIVFTPDLDTDMLDWAAYRVYRRTSSQFDLNQPTAEIMELIYESGRGDTTSHYIDYDVRLGEVYWYMVTTMDRDGLESDRFVNRAEPGGAGYETDQGAGPLILPPDELQPIHIVPNPYHPYAVQLGGTLNTLNFFNLPWTCRLRIYNQTGDLLFSDIKEPGPGGVYEWNQRSDANQYIVSGLYIVVVDEAKDGFGRDLPGGPVIGKFVVVR